MPPQVLSLSDIADAVFMLQGAPAPVISEEDAQRYADLGNEVQLAPTDLIAGQYYLRVRVCDQQVF